MDSQVRLRFGKGVMDSSYHEWLIWLVPHVGWGEEPRERSRVWPGILSRCGRLPI